jgi:SAM-dependent methyltransferase
MHKARYEFAMPFVRRRRALDVGCGEGYGAALLSQHAKEVVAIDYSPAAIAHASERYRADNLLFVVADATKLDGHLGKFDVVTCFEVIEHVSDTRGFLDRIAGALRPGGWLILSTPNALVERLFDAVRGEHYEYHVNLLTPTELRRSLKTHFQHVALYGQGAHGNGAYIFLKGLDAFNLRHRLIRSLRIQRAIGRNVLGLRALANECSPEDYRLSRMLVRQSPVTVVTAHEPIDRAR